MIFTRRQMQHTYLYIHIYKMGTSNPLPVDETSGIFAGSRRTTASTTAPVGLSKQELYKQEFDLPDQRRGVGGR